jgi:hypothetical protein
MMNKLLMMRDSQPIILRKELTILWRRFDKEQFILRLISY